MPSNIITIFPLTCSIVRVEFFTLSIICRRRANQSGDVRAMHGASRGQDEPVEGESCFNRFGLDFDPLGIELDAGYVSVLANRCGSNMMNKVNLRLTPVPSVLQAIGRPIAREA